MVALQSDYRLQQLLHYFVMKQGFKHQN
ncbi:MAG: hypothetical protein ACLRQF_16640 [Thomasclavelia ramosa]